VGTIAPGMDADLAIVDADLASIDAPDICTTRVRETWVRGKLVSPA
jgi:predicted amidohydrolase YtcJ